MALAELSDGSERHLTGGRFLVAEGRHPRTSELEQLDLTTEGRFVRIDE